MTWTAETSQGNESAKCKWDLVEYTRGQGLDLGCGPFKAFPHFIGVDNGHHDQQFGWQNKADVLVKTCEKLDIFGSSTMDFVFSSHLLEHIADHKSALREWWRVVKPGGFLILYLPHKSYYPNIGTEGSNPDHKHDFMPQDIIDTMKEVGFWDLVENQERNEQNEYAFFQVYKKRLTYKDNKKWLDSWKDPKPEKTCAIVRYGAFGDQIMASSIMPGLKEQGYHITLFTGKNGYEIAKTDPNIDKIVLQDDDQVPNEQLGHFWASLKRKYTKFINLCETVEATWLAMPGRMPQTWPHSVRAKYLDVNYLEFAHDMAEVPLPIKQKFYATPDEKAWAEKTRIEMKSQFVIMWSLSGSSVHKAWPHLDAIIARLMVSYRDLKIVLVGDSMCQLLECGWENEPRVVRKSGVWSIRESLAFIEQADLIIGPETGVLNSAGMLPVPKIISLSHSSVNNLTKHWVNCTSLEPKTSCYPCHMMHYSFDNCRRDDATGVAQCQADITPDEMYSAITKVISQRRAYA